MAMPMRVTGGWIQLLTDWLDLYQFPAPDLRLLLDSRRQDEAVPLALWQHCWSAPVCCLQRRLCRRWR